MFRAGAALRSYDVAPGFAPAGGKRREDDGQAPEGPFRINRRNPRGSFHLSLGLDCPLAEDSARAAAGGYDPGGDIFIDGQQIGVTGRRRVSFDWTAGCIAVSNDALEEPWRIAPMGTVVEIRP